MYMKAGNLLNTSGARVDVEPRTLPPVGYVVSGFGPVSTSPSAAALVVKFEYTTIPEPSATSLILIGLIIVGYVARYRIS